MKNGRLAALLFAFVLAAEAGVVLFRAFEAVDVVENGEEFMFRCENVGNISNWNMRNSKVVPQMAELAVEYGEKIPPVEAEISKAKKKKGFPSNVYVGNCNIKLGVKLGRDAEGFAKAVSYSDNPAGAGRADVKLPVWWCNFVRYDGGKKIPLEHAVLRLGVPRMELTYSRTALERIKKYLKGIDIKKRKGYVVARIKGGRVIPVDFAVNGKSFNEIASGKP